MEIVFYRAKHEVSDEMSRIAGLPLEEIKCKINSLSGAEFGILVERIFLPEINAETRKFVISKIFEVGAGKNFVRDPHSAFNLAVSGMFSALDFDTVKWCIDNAANLENTKFKGRIKRFFITALSKLMCKKNWDSESHRNSALAILKLIREKYSNYISDNELYVGDSRFHDTF